MEPITKVTRKSMEAMRPKKPYIFLFANAADYLTALRHAHWVRATHPREDGLRYTISSDSRTMTITIKVDTP